MLKDLGKRTAVSACSITSLALLLIFATYPLAMWALLFLGAAMASVSMWEYSKLALEKGAVTQKALPIFAGLLSLSLCSGSSLVPALLFFIFFTVLFLAHFRETAGSIIDLAVSIFGLVYIAIPVGMMLAILYRGPDDGRIWLAYLLIATKITDIGAYFAGSLFGRTKFFPKISPSKTVEGAIAGLICCLGVSYLFYQMGWLGRGEWVFLGALLGVMGQIGDLAESLLKRDANKKDSNALPGIGGALDSLDSLLFNAPILYLYLN